jgi:hypothetical protein
MNVFGVQGSILDSHVEVLNHRLRGLCDNVDCGQERFHEKELVGSSQCFGAALISMRIRMRTGIQHFRSMRIRIQIQGFDYQKLEIIYPAGNFFDILLMKNCSLDIHQQVKPSPMKNKHPPLQNMKFLNFFLFFVGLFCPPRSGSRSSRPKSVRIRNTSSSTMEA